RGLRRERLRERLRLVELEGHQRELLLADLDLEREVVGLCLRLRLLGREVADATVRRVDRGLELVRGDLVALSVRAALRDGALELFLAAEGVLERVVSAGRSLHPDDEGDRGQRDKSRAEGPLPPAPTSPAVPGSSHRPRIVPFGARVGQ